jgi:hypothetical protein
MKNGGLVSRRGFLESALLAGAASAVVSASEFLASSGWLEAAETASVDLIHDTFNGLFAFVVPGPDAYSVAQGVSTSEPGGVDAGGVVVFIPTLDGSTPFVPAFSATVAGALNGLAQSVNAATTGPFLSPFARLSFAEKAAVFQIMDATDSLKLLGGLLPLFAAFFTYSEAGAFDPATRSLTGQPVGWSISSYQGVSDGRDELRGYFPEHRG